MHVYEAGQAGYVAWTGTCFAWKDCLDAPQSTQEFSIPAFMGKAV